MNRAGMMVTAVLLWGLVPSADAAELTVELDAVAETVDVLLTKSRALEDQLKPGTGYIDAGQALQRFQDNAYLHMVGDFAPASEGFFALVTSGALGDVGLQRDAEWYLADSLFQLGNLATAEARLEVMVEESAHPFRDDAVRRLLELYALDGRTDEFTALYDREVLRGRVQANDLIVYSLGRAFFRRGDFEAAREQFMQVEADSPWSMRARYFVGAMDVSEGYLDEAIQVFEAVASASVDSPSDARVHDLAVLAVARIHFEQERYADAISAYDRVSGESEFNADKLYELLWTYVKQESWEEALRVVEIFQIAYPEHASVAQLRLLRGHLHMVQVQYDSAISVYEEVASEYAPIRDHFHNLSVSADPSEYLRQFTDPDAPARSDLPQYAVARMLDDPDLSRAVEVLGDLVRQEGDIEISEALIRELRGVLDSDQGIGGFEQMRYDAVLVASQAAEQSLLLLELDERWLLGKLPSGQHSKVDPLRARRLALVDAALDSSYRAEQARNAAEQHKMAVRQVRRDTADYLAVALEYAEEILVVRRLLDADNINLDAVTRAAVVSDLDYLENELAESVTGLEALDKELTQLTETTKQQEFVESGRPIGNLLEKIEALRHDYANLRPGNRLSEESERIDSLHHSLNRVHERLAKVSSALTDVERSELDLLRARFQREVGEVASQRVALGDVDAAALDVSADLTRDGFGRLESFFAESVLGADMGVIDVYWARKLSTVDEIARVREEQSELLDELDERFRLIRLKLGQ